MWYTHCGNLESAKKGRPQFGTAKTWGILYSKTLNNEYIERIHQMSYSLLSDNVMLQIFSFLIKWLYGTL